MKPPSSLQTTRTTVKRRAQRAAYDHATVEAILDEGLVCHVGFVVDGQPYVLPTIYARVGDRLYLHGSAASRMLRTLGDGVETCVTITLIDGLVLARSAFHHSMNYRSAVVLGTARPVVDRADKRRALQAIVDHVVPERWNGVREPNEQEMKATTVLGLPLAEASAKVRSGGPLDDEADYALPVWAGQLPLELVPALPIPDERLPVGVPIPQSVTAYRRPRNGRRH
jgi:nitroimidazol reductase NimA-like FMN-containing flavoprotein (pyridoxamine 5'-phosphate oxidase superfamily)